MLTCYKLVGQEASFSCLSPPNRYIELCDPVRNNDMQNDAR
jgi:hypothetical protein